MVGERLALARRAHGLSIEDVATRTKLRPRIIEAIEAGEFDLSGGEVYVIGHLRMIANAVGEDAEDVVQEYRHQRR